MGLASYKWKKSEKENAKMVYKTAVQYLSWILNLCPGTICSFADSPFLGPEISLIVILKWVAGLNKYSARNTPLPEVISLAVCLSPYIPLGSLCIFCILYMCASIPHPFLCKNESQKQAATPSSILNLLPVNFSLRKICALSPWGFPCTGSLIFVGSTVSAANRPMNDEWLHSTTLPSTSRTCATFPIWMAGYYWSG